MQPSFLAVHSCVVLFVSKPSQVKISEISTYFYLIFILAVFAEIEHLMNVTQRLGVCNVKLDEIYVSCNTKQFDFSPILVIFVDFNSRSPTSEMDEYGGPSLSLHFTL